MFLEKDKCISFYIFKHFFVFEILPYVELGYYSRFINLFLSKRKTCVLIWTSQMV